MGFHFLHLPPELADRFAREQMSLPALRDFIERRIEADIAILDEMDGGADLEADHAVLIETPEGVRTLGMTCEDEGADDEREEENEHGGDIQDEPHDAEVDGCYAEDVGPFMVSDPRAAYAADEALNALRRMQRRKAGAPAERGSNRFLRAMR